MTVHREREFKEHHQEIATWGEFVRLELGRGKTQEEIMHVLMKNGMNEEVAEIVFQASEAGF